MCLFEIDSGFGIASAADTNLFIGNFLIVPLPAVRAIAFVAAWLDAAFVKNDIAAASAVDSCLPLPFIFSAKVFQQIA